MKVILLCAGYATRLYPLTKDTPKPLLSVAEKPIVQYLLDGLKTIDAVEAIYIVTNDKFAGPFEQWCSSFSYPKEIKVINDKTTTNENRLGAIGDIHFTIQQQNIDDDLLVIAGDNIFDLELAKFIKYAEGRAPSGTIAAYDVKDIELAKKYGLVKIDSSDKIIDFQEKPKNPETTLASLGLYFYPRPMLQLIDTYITEGNNPDQPGNFVAWISQKEAVYSYVFDGIWFDIGDFTSLENANVYFKKNKKE